MKKVLFMSSIVVISIIMWLIIGCILALSFGTSPNFGYAVGSWCGQPFVVLLTVGIALLFRKQVYSVIFKTKRTFKPSVAYWLIGIAMVWGVWMIGVRTFYNYAQEKAVESFVRQESIQ